ncbi:MAG: hypothetical protein ACI841_005463, partial [Planctomycetota bacterium]
EGPGGIQVQEQLIPLPSEGILFNRRLILQEVQPGDVIWIRAGDRKSLIVQGANVMVPSGAESSSEWLQLEIMSETVALTFGVGR